MPITKFIGYSAKEVGLLVILLVTLLVPVLCGVIRVCRGQRKSITEGNYIFNFKSKNTEKILLILFVIVIFCTLYIYLMIYNFDFVGTDHSHFTFYSLRNRFFPLPVWSAEGRFLPLGGLEFNILSLFSKTAFSYSFISVFQFLTVFSLALLSLRSIPIIQAILTVFFIFITPSVVTSFFILNIPERTIIFWLVIFWVAMQFFDNSRSRISFCIALTAAQFSIYYKEIVFVLISGFALTRLLTLGISQKKVWNWNTIRQFIEDQWLDFSLLFFSAVFLSLYGIIVRSKIKVSYTDSKALEGTRLSIFLEYLQENPVLVVLIVLFLSRVFWLFRNRQTINLLWDALAVGTILYFLSYIQLKIFSSYYLAPVNFLGILYISWAISRISAYYKVHRIKLLLVLTLFAMLLGN